MGHSYLISILHYLYFAGALILALVMYMIAKFYQKKLSSKAMSKGFLVAIVALIVAITGETLNQFPVGGIITSIASAIAGIAILINVTTLYQSMRQEHK